jgi:hypothetical protein
MPNTYKLFKTLQQLKGLNYTNIKLLHYNTLKPKNKTTIQIYSIKQLQTTYKNTDLFLPSIMYDNHVYNTKTLLEINKNKSTKYVTYKVSNLSYLTVLRKMFIYLVLFKIHRQ